MSVDDPATPDDELVATLEDVDDVPDDAGHNGRLITARCVNCKICRRKRVDDDVGKDRERLSFTHVCHRCQRATWWNVVADPEVDS